MDKVLCDPKFWHTEACKINPYQDFRVSAACICAAICVLAKQVERVADALKRDTNALGPG